MLKTVLVTNTWKCDGCGVEQVSADNPFVHFNLATSTPGAPTLEFDLHKECMETLTVQGSTPIAALAEYLGVIDILVIPS